MTDGVFEAGDSLGPYTIVRRLGAGAMGEVYQARHRHMGRDAAIKVLRAELTQEEDVVNRFFTEARATATVRHPGIVEIFDCDVHRSGRAFIVMEYLAGEDLGRRLAHVGSFGGDWVAVRAVARQTASALGAAHAAGIVHRDLKPGNIFLVGDEGPVVKVVDFGIAKLMNPEGASHSQTQTGHILGTPLYMSPEQARGAKKIDERTDVYALGCVIFEMITGRPPFLGKGPAEVIVAHMSTPPPRASSLEPLVPPALDELVAAMLAKNPDERPRAMSEVVARLAEPAPGHVSTKLLAGSKPSTPEAPTAAPPPAASPARPAPASPIRAGAPGSAATRAGYAGREAQVVSRAADTTLGGSASELAAVTESLPRSARGGRGLGLGIGVAVILVAGGLALRLGRSGGGSKESPIAATSPSVAAPTAPAPAAAATPSAPVAAPPARIAISSEPAGAAVWVGDETAARGRTPFTLELAPDAPTTRVVLRAAGRQPATLTLDSNDTSSRHVVLSTAAAAQRPASSPLRRRTKKVEEEFKAIED